jgi:hypothetical protein
MAIKVGGDNVKGFLGRRTVCRTGKHLGLVHDDRFSLMRIVKLSTDSIIDAEIRLFGTRFSMERKIYPSYSVAKIMQCIYSKIEPGQHFSVGIIIALHKGFFLF